MLLGSDASGEPPAVDARLVAEGCGYEVFDGILVRVAPSPEPRARRHAKLASLLEAHVDDRFVVAVDLLTRTSAGSDLAPDASVYPRARDPRTGGRRLEHLAFEIVSAESLGHAGRKAASLAGRGVRRVFAIDVERDRVSEWSRALGAWRILDTSESLSDPALAVPLPVQALLHEAKADDAVARALLAKRNRVIDAALQGARAEGVAEGMARSGEALGKAILAVLASRAIGLSPDEQAQILRDRDPARLERWLECAATCASAAELLAIR